MIISIFITFLSLIATIIVNRESFKLVESKEIIIDQQNIVIQSKQKNIINLEQQAIKSKDTFNTSYFVNICSGTNPNTRFCDSSYLMIPLSGNESIEINLPSRFEQSHLEILDSKLRINSENLRHLEEETTYKTKLDKNKIILSPNNQVKEFNGSIEFILKVTPQ